MKFTTDEYIKLCKEIHGDRYDYSLVNYKNAQSKIKIICREHGIFEQNANKHKRGSGCPKCSKSYKKTTNQFIKEANEIHGDRYCYSLVDYKNNKIKIKIICKEHGVFEQSPDSHLRGRGCSKCNWKGVNKKTTNQFIKEANEIHGDRYDYSLVEYTSSKHKIKIICKEHGIFEQTPDCHLQKQGCPKCSNQLRTKTTEQFIKDVVKKHGDRYDYSLVEYKNSYTKIKIICKEHGIFETEPRLHLQGTNCPKCSVKYTKTIKQFIKDSISFHGNKYDYSLVEYKNNYTKVKIICKEHGVFEQTPANHITQNGCPKCAKTFCTNDEQHLYLLYDKQTNLYKIGKAKNPNKRLIRINQECYKENIIVLIEDFGFKAHFEKHIHEKYKIYNITHPNYFGGYKEFFDFESVDIDEIINYIRNL